jgi:hypothetical protein
MTCTNSHLAQVKNVVGYNNLVSNFTFSFLMGCPSA